jgi:uncharacterized protein (DUF885 family)
VPIGDVPLRTLNDALTRHQSGSVKLAGMSSARELADRFHNDWLATHPFDASYMGVPGFDNLVPDASEEGDAARRSALERALDEARRLEAADPTQPDSVTLACLVDNAERELAELDAEAVEHTVTAMPFRGPAELLSVAARTVLPDPDAARDYLSRLGESGRWVDQQTERLGIGAAKGRLPVAPLVALAIEWMDGVLTPAIPEAVAAPTPPTGWDGEAAWRDERDRIVATVLRPALRRWAEFLRELAPRSRSADQPGLKYLPNGDADYERAIRSHTTLSISAGQLHQTGLDQISALEQRATELGLTLGLAGLPAVREAILASAGVTRPEEAMAAARRAVRRAEAEATTVFPAPLPGPCAVEPMPPVVAASGAAPHYTPPRLDGTRLGTYWFNTRLPTAGTGWDLEAVAFHEAVPGHHLQLSRIQMLSGLPDLQRQRYVTAFSEGWGLYAEQLADEMGLYTGSESLLGATTASLMRAARLVIDTGIHNDGWSRQKALDFFVEHVPMPAEFLAAEIDRYIMWPGQALAYLTGMLELLRARQRAQERLGTRFSLPDFHAAVLDSGSVPIEVLHQNIDRWVEQQ